MKKQGKILVVDDNRNILSSLRLLLDDVFEDVTTLPSPKTMLNVLAQGVDAVLLDMNFVAGINNGNEGLYWLHKINDKFPDVPVVLFTAYADVELAVQAMKDGAFDFVEKPWDNARLIDTLTRAVKSRLESAPANPAPTEMVWGQSEAMLRLKTLVEKVARTDANVLITGETVRERMCSPMSFTACLPAWRNRWCVSTWVPLPTRCLKASCLAMSKVRSPTPGLTARV